MLSYRHAFHAGMHADVLKHCALVHVLQHMLQKDKPFWCIDTHAGAASYALRGQYAKKSGEAQSGIGRLWGRGDLPAPLAAYMELVKADNIDGAGSAGELKYYPGSPWIADHLLRPKDRLRLFELHSTEIRLLQRHFRNAAPRVVAEAGDGFEGLLSVLPPPPRRGLALIDPSYEDKRDYRRTIAALKGGLERFATGTFMVWYPQVAREEAQKFPDQLKRVREKGWLHATLTVKSPPAEGFGLYGSGIFLVNPPYTLPGALKEALPYLAKLLGQDGTAAFSLESKLE
jgi:23S rRNA (adenine2030-N6)-methyltransferase